MGYGEKMVRDLEQTIANSDVDVVVSGTPIDMRRVMTIDKPIVKADYKLQEIGYPALFDVIEKKLAAKRKLV